MEKIKEFINSPIVKYIAQGIIALGIFLLAQRTKTDYHSYRIKALEEKVYKQEVKYVKNQEKVAKELRDISHQLIELKTTVKILVLPRGGK